MTHEMGTGVNERMAITKLNSNILEFTAPSQQHRSDRPALQHCPYTKREPEVIYNFAEVNPPGLGAHRAISQLAYVLQGT